MASFTSLVSQVLMKIPVEKREQERKNVELLVGSSIETLSKIAKWNWRENYEDVSLTAGTATYNLNETADFLSGKQGFFVDSSGNPSKHRLVVIDEDTFNQMYVDYKGEDTSETPATPEYIVMLTRRSQTGGLKVRFFPVPSANLTARVYYMEKPALGDAVHMIESMILYETYSKMPIEWVGDPSYWASQSLTLQKRLAPLDRRASTGKRTIEQDVRVAKTLRSINAGGSRR